MQRLSFLEFDNAAHRRLIRELAKACEKKKTIEISQSFHRESNCHIQEGILKAATIAIAMNMPAEALAIAEAIPHKRPPLWSFTDRFSNKDAFPFITYTALHIAAKKLSVSEHTLLPQELIDIGARVPDGTKGDAFRKALKTELEEHFESQKGLPDEKRPMRYETKREAERFLYR